MSPKLLRLARLGVASVACATAITTAGLAVPSSMSPAHAGPLDPILASGTLLDTAGSPIVGAQITVDMWPNDDVMSSLDEGDAVNLVEVASAVTTSGGRFSVTIPSIAPLLAGALDDGLANFSLVASTADGTVAEFAFTRGVLATTIAGTVHQIIVDPSSVEAAINGLLDSVLTNLLATLHWVIPESGIVLQQGHDATAPAFDEDDVPTDATDSPDDPSPDPMPTDTGEASTETPAPVPAGDVAVQPKSCTTTLLKKYSPWQVAVGQEASISNSVKMDFTYSKGASTSLGVAVNEGGGNNAPGKFHLGGTASTSTTATQVFGARTGKGYFGRRTLFQYGLFQNWCFTQYATSTVWDEIRPYKWAGGATTLAWSPTPTATNCVPEEKNGKWIQDTSAAIKWDDGVQIGPDVANVSLSSQTGYNSHASVAFTFTSAGRMCGTGGYPGGSPRILVAKGP